MKTPQPRLVRTAKPQPAAAPAPAPQPPQPTTTKPKPLATVATFVKLYRAPDVADGPISTQEQIDAVERHLKFHRRQVEVAETLLAKLRGTE
jgi:hypothetical protein